MQAQEAQFWLHVKLQLHLHAVIWHMKNYLMPSVFGEWRVIGIQIPNTMNEKKKMKERN